MDNSQRILRSVCSDPYISIVQTTYWLQIRCLLFYECTVIFLNRCRKPMHEISEIFKVVQRIYISPENLSSDPNASGLLTWNSKQNVETILNVKQFRWCIKHLTSINGGVSHYYNVPHAIDSDGYHRKFCICTELRLPFHVNVFVNWPGVNGTR